MTTKKKNQSSESVSKEIIAATLTSAYYSALSAYRITPDKVSKQQESSIINEIFLKYDDFLLCVKKKIVD